MSSTRSIDASVLEVMHEIERIDEFSRAILPTRSEAFGQVSLRPPQLNTDPELAFIRATSWLYVLCYEAGRVSVKHLVQDRPHLKKHWELIGSLRTWAQHNLDPTSTRAVQVAKSCEDWFHLNCETRQPRSTEHWMKLCLALLDGTAEFLRGIHEVIGEIEAHPGYANLVEDWERKLSRDWPAHRFHTLIKSAAVDCGWPALDPVRFYRQYAAELLDHLRLLDDECDLEVEVRRAIEARLTADLPKLLPITGQDIMTHFNIGPGPEVGRLLADARTLHEEIGPCSGHELLAQLETGDS